MKNLILAVLILIPAAAVADEAPSAWSHESEAAIVTVGGNTKSESYSAKQKTTYKKEENSYTLAGRYLQSKAASVETARSWDASLRYERELTGHWSAFVQQGAESDPYAGYVQRDSTDLGAKYYFIKNEKVENLFAEAGVRSTTTIPPGAAASESTNGGRLFVQYDKQATEAVFVKFWVEYIPDFKTPEAWLLNYEPSMSVMMSEIFSLKVSYLVKHHDLRASPADEKDDTTFTTSLVAKF